MILTIASALKGAPIVLSVLLAPQSPSIPACRPDPVLTRLFTPSHPQLGRYEVCTTPRPLADVAPRDWTIDAVQALDAFGGIGASGGLDRSALARLYGGRRANVARGWIEDADRFESVTLVSPYPNVPLTRLEPGTLIVRFVLDGARIR
jgi:hypothetical protein